jgi:hypothetical protein
MKKSVVLWILCISISFLVTGCVVAVEGPPPAPVVAVEGPQYGAQVEVGAPPPLAISEPELVVVPSGDAYVYMIPNVAGVYFYDGLWYRNYGGAWFRAGMYNGPWVGIAAAPGVVIGIDPFWPFYLPVGYYRIGWGDFHNHWRDWGYRHHWHSHTWFKREMRSDIRHNRLNRIKQDRLRGIDRSKKTFKSSSAIKSSTFKSSSAIKKTTFKRASTVKSVNTVKNIKTYKNVQTNKNVQKNVGHKEIKH